MVSHPTDDGGRSADDGEDGQHTDRDDGTREGGTEQPQRGETSGQTAGDEQTETTERRRDEARERARSQILDCIEAPAESASMLPYLLSYLESEAQTVRWLSATACCLIAIETDDDEVTEYLLRRMTDRLTEEGISLELTAALDYLSSTFPDQSSRLLAEMDDDEEVVLPEVGNFTRSYYYGQELGREDVGRLRIAGADGEDNPEHVVGDRQREEREQIEYERRRREHQDETADDETDEDEPAERADDQLAGNSSTTVQESTTVSTIAEQSRFDELYIRGERSRGRYATTYEALVGAQNEREAVALRLFHQPENGLAAFGRELADQLARWEAASDHESVVTVYDWGAGSRQWVSTELIGELLAERDRPAVPVAFDHALALVEAVAHLHQNDVVHGGIDPQTIGFPDQQFDRDEDHAQRPLLNNVGLLNVFRYYFQPADCLDPRFAAPEYYDDRFGRVDHATDIYHLGAVCYLLFTGRPPFTGGFETVREDVHSRRPAPPTSVADGLPSELDGILAKTMAKQKIRRYETVEQFQGELSSLAGAFE